MSALHTIHLLHHTHTDYGYTDLPSTMRRLQRDYTRKAVELIDTHRSRPDDSRFRWTIEVSDLAHDFLQLASTHERERLLAARADGLLDVGALPFHPTGFSGAAEWDAIEHRLAPTWNLLRPRTAILNDVNGLPWALVPRLLDLGVRWLSTGLNTHSGRPPRPRPSFFHWEGPDGRTMLVWLGLHYCEGYFFFHETEWRRGPIPHAHDVFFHPPEPGDIWRTDDASLTTAETVLTRRLRDLGSYPFAHFALQVTNMWRMDNDPPFPGLCDFVQAWNASGRTPRLRLSTFEQFFQAIETDSAFHSVPTLRGDWVNWWADGIASVPRENIAIARAVRILTDLPGTEAATDSPLPPAATELAASSWWNLSLFNEHTVDGHNAMSLPDGSLSLGHKAYTTDLAFRAEEEARLALAMLLRQAPAYVPARRAPALTVLNPGPEPRSGWIEIPAESLACRPASLLDPLSGHRFPLEPVLGPRWSEPRAHDAPPIPPNDTFGFETVSLRAFIPHLPPGGALRLLPDPSTPASPDDPRAPWSWQWHHSRLTQLGGNPGENWIDPSIPFGAIIADLDHTFGARYYLTALDGEKVRRGRQRSYATVVEHSFSSGFYGETVRLTLQHPLAQRIEQEWLLHRLCPRLELTTTLWLKESFTPLCLALAFPFTPACGELAYTSFGIPTRAGHDQLPGCCGDFVFTEGLTRIGPRLVLHSPGVPLAAYGSLRVHEGTTAALPDQPHIFSIFALTHWNTNFPHLLPGKLVLRHTLALDTAPPDGLLAMPSA